MKWMENLQVVFLLVVSATWLWAYGSEVGPYSMARAMAVTTLCVVGILGSEVVKRGVARWSA